MKITLPLFILLLINTSLSSQMEEVPVICNNLSYNEKSVIAVSDFEVTARGAQRQSSTAMKDMLSNALLNSGCFRVVERQKMDAILNEQSLGLTGAVDSRSAAAIGNLQGAEILVFGNLTEFKENESGVGLGTFSRRLGGVGLGMTAAHVGFIIKLVDASTGEVLVQKSFNKKVRKVGGLTGSSFLGVAAGALFFKSQAMADAIEDAIIDASKFIADERSKLPIRSKAAEINIPTSSECSIMSKGSGPKVMVIIPEVHISRRVPDPAGETEIIRKLIEFGYTVLDPTQVEAIRKKYDDDLFVNNPDKAAKLGKRFNCDIIIVGEAFSESGTRTNTGNLISCRARVEARAIETSTGRIIATNGLHAGGVDNTELVAGKAALKNAGSAMADYFITQLCDANVQISNEKIGYKKSKKSSGKKMLVTLNNIDFNTYDSIKKHLDKMNKVAIEKKGYKDGVAKYLLRSSISLEDITSSLNRSYSLEVSSLSSNKMEAKMN